MGHFRKRPTVVEAYQWLPEDLLAAGEVIGKLMVDGASPHIHNGKTLSFVVRRSEGAALIRPGDWVIAERDGNGFYPCTAADFDATYDPCEVSV